MTMAEATHHQQVDAHDSSLAGARVWFAQKGLSRPREGRVLAGVSIVGVLVLTPLAYIAAWILMPNDADGAPIAA
jgi:hypothetical protein